jgi:alcohol dehydrogenase class IV
MPSFYSPIVFFGEDALDEIESMKGSKVLIVSDKILVELGVVKIVTDKLDECDKKWEIFDEVEPDPHETTILKALEQCKTLAPDLIIGVGGGSSIDAAKGIWYLYEHDEFTIDDLTPFEDLHMGQKAKMIAIPTTSGTGAEATWAVVITRVDENGNQSKLEQANRDVIPTYAIIDPVFTMGLPKKLTAATGFDAIGHCCEGLIADWKNDFADANCIHAMDIIKEYLVKAYNDGSDVLAREKMANAATIAGLGFGNSQIVMGHSMAHSLGAVFHITHGIAVGVMLPYVLEFCLKDQDDDSAVKILGKSSKKLGLAQWSDDDATAANNLVEYVKELRKNVDLPSNLKDCGVAREDLDKNMERLVLLANESASITMTPRQASNAEIQKVYEYAFEGKSIDF